MEMLKNIAVQSYRTLWNGEEKSVAERFFRNLDNDGDTKVTVEELRASGIISSNLLKVFKKADMNRNGVLDFDEVLSLYFYKIKEAECVKKYKRGPRYCDGCVPRTSKSIPDYSCFACLKEGMISYDLCSNCFCKRVHQAHDHHPDWYMLPRTSLDVLDKMKFLLFEDHLRYKTEGLKAIAVNTYGDWTDEQKKKADEYFSQLDCNREGKVDLMELMSTSINMFNILNQFDVNGSGVLDFDEIMTLYYYKNMVHVDIMAYKPKPQWCRGKCGRRQTLPDFSCFLCLTRRFRDHPGSYHLCYSCYSKGVHKKKHKHEEWYILDRQSLDVIHQMKKLVAEGVQVQGQGLEQNNKPNNMQMVSQADMASSILSMVNSAVALVALAGGCTIM